MTVLVFVSSSRVVRHWPMGWSNSVRIAQLIHENLLYEPHVDIPAALRSEGNILHVQHPDIVRPLHALYVDDSILFGLASDPEEAKRQYNRMLCWLHTPVLICR